MINIQGFEIRRDAEGYYLLDRDGFNNWEEVRNRDGSAFLTRAAAESFAQRAGEFKTGRRMSLD